MSDKTPEADDASFVVDLPWGPVTLPIPSTDSSDLDDGYALDDEFREEVFSRRELREMGEDFNPPHVFLRAYIHPEITHLFVESWCIQVWAGGLYFAEDSPYRWDEHNPWYYEFDAPHMQRLVGLYGATDVDHLIQILQAELDAHPDEDENEAWRGPETLHTKLFEYGYLPEVNSQSDLRPIWRYDTFRELYDEKRLNEIISSGAPLMKGGHQSLEQALEYIEFRPAD